MSGPIAPSGPIVARPGACAADGERKKKRAREEAREDAANEKGKEVTHSLPLSTYSAPGALRQGPGRAGESPAVTGICGNGVW